MNEDKYVWHGCITLKNGINEAPFLANIPPEKLLIVETSTGASPEILLQAIKPRYIGRDAALSFTKANFNDSPDNPCFVSQSLQECQKWYVARMNACICELDRRMEHIKKNYEIARSECQNNAHEISKMM